MLLGTPKTGPKILLWDIETSPLVVASFGLFDQNIPTTNIIHEWFIICAAWQWYGHDEIYSVAISDNKKRFKNDFRDDRYVVDALHALLMEADIIVAQNGDAFDLKKLAARSFYHGLPPLPKVPSVDTLKEARRAFKMTSNKLDYVGEFLGIGKKVETERGLWMRAMSGDSKAIDKMVVYCKGDIELLHNYYEKLRPYMQNHPNMNVFQRTDYCCPSCGSPKVERSGYRITKTGKKQRWKCNGCGSWSQGGSTLEKSELR